MNKQIYKGHFARKRFGQFFLIDQFIINKIVDALNPKPNEIIIEIGPGLGALTLPVSKYIDKMIVIELDRNLVSILAKDPIFRTKLTIIENDVMKINFSAIAKEKGKSLRIFGNLPYNISTSLIFYLINYINNIIDMNFMLQKEVVNRLIAEPNTKIYGRLSIMAQYYYNIITILEIPSSSFIPIPKVNSSVIRLIPHQKNPYTICNVKLLNYIVTQAFNQRRKVVYNSLNNLFSIQDFKQLGINKNYRAENISVENYCKLASRLEKNRSKNNIF
ncbi:MAG: 16S rRNA (adenine(1518)-N(6)/adenine(1519)-N(6)) -dimethyltransferase RsmA [Arsenophonus endosymbiont of Ceratovacuna japonica]